MGSQWPCGHGYWEDIEHCSSATSETIGDIVVNSQVMPVTDIYLDVVCFEYILISYIQYITTKRSPLKAYSQIYLSFNYFK